MTFEKKAKGLGVRPKPIFVLTQDISEKEMFKSLHKYLGCGYLTKNKTSISLYITSLYALSNILFPILYKYPLKYGKLSSYLIFKNIVEQMLNKNHLNLEGLVDIIYLAFKLNIETGRRTNNSKENLINFLKTKYGKLPEPRTVPEDIMSNIHKSNLTLDFIAGLIDANGSFNVAFQIKPYKMVKVNFTVVQETSWGGGKNLLNELKSYFSCGEVYDLASTMGKPGRSVYKLDDVNLILNNLAPILNKVNFNSKKGQDYKIMIKVCEILKLKYYVEGVLSDEIFIKIIELAYDKNKLGKKRTISKEKLIQKVKHPMVAYRRESRLEDQILPPPLAE